MTAMMRISVLLIASLVLSSCIAIESNRAGNPFLNANGEPKRTQIAGTYSLPRRYLSLEVYGSGETMRSSSRFRIERKVDQEVLSPDPSPLFRYEINYVPNRFSKDEVEFQIEDQILKSVTVSTDDQTGQALINLAKSLGNIARLRKGLTDDLVPGSSINRQPETLIAKLRLDPTDPVSVARTRSILSHNAHHGVAMHITPEPRSISQAPGCNFAVCYRPLISVTITFVDKASGNVTEFVVQVPDPHQITGVDIERSTFVKRDTIYTFADGSLTAVDITKPSELAAAALLPLDIVNAVFEGTNQAISSLLGLRQNELQASTDLLNAQANFLNALKSYRDTEEEVLGVPDGESPLPGNRVSGRENQNNGSGGLPKDPDDDQTPDDPNAGNQDAGEI